VLDGPSLGLAGGIARRHLCVVHALEALVIQAQASVGVDDVLADVPPLLVELVVLHAGHHHHPVRWGLAVLHRRTAQLVAQHLRVGEGEQLRLLQHLSAGIQARVVGLLVVLQQIVQADVGVDGVHLAPAQHVFCGHKLFRIDILQVPLEALAAELLAQHHAVGHIADVRVELQVRPVEEEYVDVLIHPHQRHAGSIDAVCVAIVGESKKNINEPIRIQT